MQAKPATSMPHESVSGEHAATQLVHVRSVLKRALLWLVLLFIMVTGGAWLMHAGIQAEAEPAPDEPVISVPAR